jgi:hypothetical protein
MDIFSSIITKENFTPLIEGQKREEKETSKKLTNLTN